MPRHVGHAYSAETMLLALDENLRRALGSALRALEERVALTDKLRKQASQRGYNRMTDLWTRKKAEVEEEAEVIGKAILRAERTRRRPRRGLASTQAPSISDHEFTSSIVPGELIMTRRCRSNRPRRTHTRTHGEAV